mmetsp:Transcript_2823/g.4293  ORF Transcript_2823/g.4293 Transcript_2823/m.4293 type:complete len:142 (+) Transcript_2823:1537-1962(+)
MQQQAELLHVTSITSHLTSAGVRFIPSHPFLPSQIPTNQRTSPLLTSPHQGLGSSSLPSYVPSPHLLCLLYVSVSSSAVLWSSTLHLNCMIRNPLCICLCTTVVFFLFFHTHPSSSTSTVFIRKHFMHRLEPNKKKGNIFF